MPKIANKLDQLKQLASEKIFHKDKTRAPDAFLSLKTSTATRRDEINDLNDSLEDYLRVIGTDPSGQNKNKSLPVETFGHVCRHVGDKLMMLGDDEYGKALEQVGETHEFIGCAQKELHVRVHNGLHQSLQTYLNEAKEYDRLTKKLHHRRLEFDAKLAKHKSPSSSSLASTFSAGSSSSISTSDANEHHEHPEILTAKAKFQGTMQNVEDKMGQLNATGDEQLYELYQMVNAEVEYFEKCLELTRALKNRLETSLEGKKVLAKKPVSVFQQPPESSSSLLVSNTLSTLQRSESNDSALDTQSISTVVNEEVAVPNDTPIVSSISRMSIQEKEPPIPPKKSTSTPSSSKFLRTVRAIHDFTAEAPNELSIHRGDVIHVLYEVNEGWWQGENVTTSKQGMFPGNYCEIINEREQPEATINTRRPPPPPPRSPSYVASIGASKTAVASRSRCTVDGCQCSDFSPHVFKKTQCKNCFHEHS